jgi:crossover junction endodeoxyribonuclease RusA
MTSLRITLPWPSPKLHPNQRVHWAQKAHAAKKARADAKMCTFQAMVRTPVVYVGRIPVAITFHPPDKRRRDTDGMLSALKSSLDGVADALGVDDNLFDLSLTVGEPVKGGEVVVTVGSV